MDIQIKKADFLDDRFTVDFGANKRVTFIVVNESFHGNNQLGVINRINIFIETVNAEGIKTSGNFSTSIIGVGDGLAGVLTENEDLLGKVLSWDNFEQCTIRLYE